MKVEVLDILNATLALVAIINPLGNLPIFVELTSDLDKATRRRLFNLTVITG